LKETDATASHARVLLVEPVIESVPEHVEVLSDDG